MLIDIQKQKAEEESKRSNWEEYNAISKQFFELWQSKTCRPLFRNLAIRILELEKNLGIPIERSVTAATGYDEDEEEF